MTDQRMLELYSANKKSLINDIGDLIYQCLQYKYVASTDFARRVILQLRRDIQDQFGKIEYDPSLYNDHEYISFGAIQTEIIDVFNASAATENEISHNEFTLDQIMNCDVDALKHA